MEQYDYFIGFPPVNFQYNFCVNLPETVYSKNVTI